MSKPTAVVVFVTLLAVGLSSDNAKAITVNLNAAKDNTLYQDANGTLSNGAGPSFFAGRTGGSGPGILRGLLMFDIAAQVPSSVTVTSATLTLNVSKVSSSLADAIQLRRVDIDWGEAGSVADGGNGGGGAGGAAQPGDATWTHSFSPNTAWTTVGGDFSSVLSASQSVADIGSYTWSDAQLTLDVQDMLDTAQSNFGWLLQGNEASEQTNKRFSSRESSNPPVLTIEYEVSNNSPDADFDDDNDVDGEDLADWLSAFGPGSGGDADGDKDTDGADFLVWQREYTGPSGLQSFAIPEPSTAVLAWAFLALVASNRRSRGPSQRN